MKKIKDEGRQLHVRLPEEVYKKLKVKCVYADTSMQDYVANIIAESVAGYSTAEQPVKESTSQKRSKRRA